MDRAAARCGEKLLVRCRIPEKKRQTRSLGVSVQSVLLRIGRIRLGRFHPEEELWSQQQTGQRKFQACVEVSRLFRSCRRCPEANQNLGFGQRPAKEPFTVSCQETTGAGIVRPGRIGRFARDRSSSLLLAEDLVGYGGCQGEVLFETG